MKGRTKNIHHVRVQRSPLRTAYIQFYCLYLFFPMCAKLANWEPLFYNAVVLTY